jgi:hypothetical protein
MSIADGGVRVEGYWADTANDTSAFPWPCRASDWISRNAFIDKLRLMERKARDKSVPLCFNAFRGFYRSRIDGSPLGNKEYSFHLPRRQGSVAWPDSLLSHYVVEHGIRVSLEFERWVMEFPIPESVGDCYVREHMSIIEGGTRVEGYWADTAEGTSLFPWPCRAPQWSSRSAFIEKLLVLEAYARHRVEGFEVISYLGMSYSRLDGSVVGSDEFRFYDDTGGLAIAWPESLLSHYIEERGIRVSLEFERWVMDFPLSTEVEPQELFLLRR